MLNTTFIINGGAGRVITAIPALEKYARLNPDDNFTVLVHGWESLYWSHPLLQERTFSIGQKGTFDQYIRSNRVVCAEPYYVRGYYNQELSLAQAFDQEINCTEDHTDLQAPKVYLSTLETNTAHRMLQEKKQEFNKNKVVVIQPYGSGMGIANNRPFDNSHRSMDVDDYLSLVTKLRDKNKDLLIVYFGQREFQHPGDKISTYIDVAGADLRMYMALINACDYFVGCDSVGQHMARALNKPGLVLMGATDEVNVSYPDYFDIYRHANRKPIYSPIRITGQDCEFADRMNDGIMKFSSDQLDEICQRIMRNLYEL
jgi:ADP-heptose:LPS heptosyltransferase